MAAMFLWVSMSGAQLCQDGTGHACVIMPWAALGKATHFLMVEGGDPFPSLGTGDIKSGVLGPVLDSPG